jgi:hypothetical protein
MVDATTSRVRLRDLARPGRFRPDARPRSGLASGVRFATRQRHRGVQPRHRFPVAPRSASLRPGADDLVASTI